MASTRIILHARNVRFTYGPEDTVDFVVNQVGIDPKARLYTFIPVLAAHLNESHNDFFIRDAHGGIYRVERVEIEKARRGRPPLGEKKAAKKKTKKRSVKSMRRKKNSA